MALVGLQGAVLPSLFPSRSHHHSSIQQGLWAPQPGQRGGDLSRTLVSSGPFLSEANSIKATCQRVQCLTWGLGGGARGTYCLKSSGCS